MKKILALLLVMLLTVQSVFASGAFIGSIYQARNTGVVRTLEGNNNRNVPIESSGFSKEVLDRKGSFHDITPNGQETVAEEQWVNQHTNDIRYRLQQRAAQPTMNALINDVHNAIDPDNPESAGFWKYCIKPSLFLSLINKNLLSSLVLFRYITAAFGIELDQFKMWSVTQLFALYQTLYSLPRAFVQYTKQLFRQAVAFGNRNILGYMYWSRPYRIYICNSAFSYGQFAGTVVHEMAHIFDANADVQTRWKQQFYKLSSGRYVFTSAPPTSYGCTNIKEDIAESVRYYWSDGAAMKKQCPERYEFIRQYIMQGAEYR